MPYQRALAHQLCFETLTVRLRDRCSTTEPSCIMYDNVRHLLNHCFYKQSMTASKIHGQRKNLICIPYYGDCTIPIFPGSQEGITPCNQSPKNHAVIYTVLVSSGQWLLFFLISCTSLQSPTRTGLIFIFSELRNGDWNQLVIYFGNLTILISRQCPRILQEFYFS